MKIKETEVRGRMNLKTLLVVDDEKHIRMLYKEVLENEGYRVLFAENGQQVFSIIEKEQINWAKHFDDILFNMSIFLFCNYFCF